MHHDGLQTVSIKNPETIPSANPESRFNESCMAVANPYTLDPSLPTWIQTRCRYTSVKSHGKNVSVQPVLKQLEMLMDHMCTSPA